MTSYTDLRPSPVLRTTAQPLWYFALFDSPARPRRAPRARAAPPRPLHVASGRTLDLGAGDDVIVVWRGTVLIADEIRARRAMRALLGEGDVFGVCGPPNRPTPAQTAEARDDCALRILTRESFVRMMAGTPELPVSPDLVGLAAETRLAHALLSRSSSHAAMESSGELARSLGLRDSTVRRLLAVWRLYGWLEEVAGGLRLRDPDALERLARGE
jgi:hypothetical protein